MEALILIGIIAATVLRIVFALLTTQLLQIVGLILIGGILLLWVAWKMWRDLHHSGESGGSPEVEGDEHSGIRPAKSFAAAAKSFAEVSAYRVATTRAIGTVQTAHGLYPVPAPATNAPTR